MRSKTALIAVRRLLMMVGIAAVAGCGGFGAGNVTSPGSTPNISAQSSYRIVGAIGTPFFAIISDARSSWQINGIVPLSIVIANDTPPDRILAVKTVNNNSLLSLEITTGFTVKQLASTSDPYGVAVGGVRGPLPGFAPPASPDVRFFVKGPDIGIFNALIEDQVNGEIVQSRAPSLILFDSPSGGANARVDGIFTQVTFPGPFAIDLIFNGAVVRTAVGGNQKSLKFP
jgi:hypothetical protein